MLANVISSLQYSVWCHKDDLLVLAWYACYLQKSIEFDLPPFWFFEKRNSQAINKCNNKSVSNLCDNNKNNYAALSDVSCQDTSESESEDERKCNSKAKGTCKVSLSGTECRNNEEEDIKPYLIAWTGKIARNHTYLKHLGLLEKTTHPSNSSADTPNSTNRIAKRSSPSCTTPSSSSLSIRGSTRKIPRIEAQRTVDLTGEQQEINSGTTRTSPRLSMLSLN